MRYVNLEVPAEVLTHFVREMQQREIKAVIVGIDDDDEFELRIGFEKEETEKIDELEEVLEELIDSLPDEEEEEEEDDDNDRRKRR